MKMRSHFVLIALALFSCFSSKLATGYAQGTAFTYQGRLTSGNSPVNGSYDLTFALFNAPSGGSAVAGPVTTNAVAVSNGLFAVGLDFGSGIFNGAAYWLEIGVRTNGVGGFTSLVPRQALNPAPYAIFAEGANAAGLNGTLPPASLGGTYGNVVNFNNGANGFDGSFYGQFYGSTFTGGIFTGAFVGSGSGLGDVWHTGGNLGTTAGLNFLGTTDNQPLELHVNGVRALRLEPTPTNGAVNVLGGSPNNFVAHGVVGATIGGGGALNYSGAAYSNSVSFDFGTIGGGYANLVNGFAGVVAGGYNNANNGFAGFMGAGDGNTIVGNGGGDGAVIGGGYGNTNGGSAATISGGQSNFIDSTADHAGIGSGQFNTVQSGADHAAIGGGYGNTVGTNNSLSVIGGGQVNTANSMWATIGGGYGNNAGYVGTVAGGDGNGANGNFSFVGGGYQNIASAQAGFVGGGYNNTNAGFMSLIGGGRLNTVFSNAFYATIGGGYANYASGGLATIAGGDQNFAAGDAFAAGHRAKANNFGAFVWADSTDADFASTANNQFAVRASGGVAFVTGGAGMTLDGQPIVSGIYSNTVILTNANNTFAGNGAGLSNVNAALLNGLPSSAFIQNQSAGPQAASFNINGTAQVLGLIRSGSEVGTSNAPSPAGLVIRRVNSTTPGSGQVVARSDVLTLQRDGSNGGLLIAYPAGAGEQTIAAMGINNTGGQVNFFQTLASQATAGTVQIYLDSQSVVYAQISFGNTYLAGHLTQVTITRAYNDNYWVGTVTSTYNQ
jgi:hypothetical protein